jgi:hypothetical protein
MSFSECYSIYINCRKTTITTFIRSNFDRRFVKFPKEFENILSKEEKKFYQKKIDFLISTINIVCLKSYRKNN